MTYTDLGVTYQYITRGITYNLNGYDADHGLTLHYLGDQGFGLTPLHRITTRGPLQHGDSDIDFRLDPRILQIPLVVKNESAAAPKYTHYTIRKALLNIFRPQESAVLRVLISYKSGMVANIDTYNIDVKVLGGMTFDVDPIDYHVRTVVQLRANDPTWYAPDPFGNALVFTYFDINIGGTQILAVDGNWPTFPIIRFNGPITNPTITNNATGQSIALTATITAGNWIELDLSYGKKTVYDNLGANRISTVSATSNLATWSIIPGSNTLAVTGTGTSASSDVTLTYYHRYTGI